VSRAAKSLQKLFRLPPPKDFAWEAFETVMTRAGFTGRCSGGSHYTFTHESGFCFGISKTHPSGVLKAYQVRDAKEALSRVGVNGESDG
jgi:hypothetical protein